MIKKSYFRSMAILVFVGLLTATQTLIAQNLNFSQSSPGNCDILITQQASNGAWIYTQKGVKAGSTLKYGTNGWHPFGAGFDAWRWRIKGATAYKLSGESSFTTIDPSIFQCITMSTSGEHIDVVWGSQNANARIEVVTSGNCSPSNFGTAQKGGCNGSWGVSNPVFGEDIVVNNSITTSGTVSIKDANGASFRNVACNTVQDFSISLQPAGNYFNDINWDVTPNNNGDLYVESNGSYGNATLKSRSNFIPSGSYRIDAGCHAGQGNIGAATPYYINISTPAPTLPYVTLSQVCRNTTVLVHAGTTTGSTSGYQQTEFEIDPTSPALFNDNQQKTIVRNTGNVNVDINATTPNAVVKVRCRNIFSCGTSDWSPYLSIDIFDVNPLSLVNTTGNTYACVNEDLDLQLNLETAANLVNGATITYEIVGTSPARILDLRTSPATQSTSLTYTLPNITVKPNGATSDIVVRARVNYPCRQTNWVTATFTLGAISSNNLAIVPLNLETTCLDNVEFEAVGVNLAEIESIVWSAKYYQRVNNNPNSPSTSHPFTSFVQSGLKGNKLQLDVTSFYDLPRVDYFEVNAAIKRCGITGVLGSFTLSLLGKNACSPANLASIPNSVCLTRDPKCDDPFEPSQDRNPNLTGVNNQIIKGQGIEVYPNPSYNHPLTLKIPTNLIGKKIEVFTSTGQLVQTIIAQDPEQKLELPKGIYMLKVQGANDASVKVVVN